MDEVSATAATPIDASLRDKLLSNQLSEPAILCPNSIGFGSIGSICVLTATESSGEPATR